MAGIKITELSPAGSELFQDSESFLEDMLNDELGNIRGGYSYIQYQLLLQILNRLTAVTIQLPVSSIQTVASNSVNNNTINSAGNNAIGIGNSIFNGLTINGLSLSNVNTVR